MAKWAIADRERWGRRANELAEEGVEWPHDEQLAYLEITAPHPLEREDGPPG